MGKKIFIAILVILIIALIGGGIYYFANNNSNNSSTENQSSNANTQNENNQEVANTSNEENSQNTTNNENSNNQEGNILVAYYSHTGNTEEFANIISEETGGTLFEIERLNDYSDLYTEAEDEINNNERPELAGMPENVEQYDTIFIGYPIWLDRTPAMINTFLGNIDLDGKTVIPFCTSSSDGIEGSMTDIRNSAQGANILDGLRVSGSNVESSRSEIQNWLAELGY